MLAFLTRRKDTPMPDTAPTTEQVTQTDDVVMRFLTQGGATVELHHQDCAVHTNFFGERLPDGQTRTIHGFNWRCLGCDAIGGGGRYGLGPHHYDEHKPGESRDDANTHAATCRAMPKPAA